VTVNVPNPNYVETISGTLGNPWGGKFAAIRNEVEAGDATAVMTFYGFSGFGEIVEIDTVKYFVFSGSSPEFPPDRMAQFTLFRFLYDYASGDPALDGEEPAFVLGSSTAETRWTQTWPTASADASVTVIHHPLPDSE
jgi:hypothetical protein